jgi:hypothetical protein
MDERRGGSQDLSPQERFARFSNDARWMQNQARDILTPRQQKRLREIDLQFKGARAFEEQEVIEKLHLDDNQRAKIRTILAQEFSATFAGFHSCPMEQCDGNPGGRPPGEPPLGFERRPPKGRGDGHPTERPPHEPPPGFEGKKSKGKWDGPQFPDRSRELRKEFGKKPPMEKRDGRRSYDHEDLPPLENGDKPPSFDAVQMIVAKVLESEQKIQWQELIGKSFPFKPRLHRGPRGLGGISDHP